MGVTGLPLDRLGDSFDEIFAAAYSVSVFTDWRSDEAVRCGCKCRTDRRARPTPGQPWLGARPADRPTTRCPAMPADALHRATGRARAVARAAAALPAGLHAQQRRRAPVGVSCRAPRPPRRSRRCAASRDRIAPVVQVSEVRTIAADELWLSPAYGRDSVALHFTWVPDHAAVIAVVAAMEELLLPLGARPHWGKLTTVAPERIVASYERAADFGRLLADHDPAGKFRNPFLDDFFPADSWRADR